MYVLCSLDNTYSKYKFHLIIHIFFILQYSDEDGPCISNYINLDRLQILETMYKSSYDLWNRAKCEGIFFFLNYNCIIISL